MSEQLEELTVPVPCNTFITTGFHLHDLSVVKDKVREAIHYLAAYPDDIIFTRNLLTHDIFPCSHCGLRHMLTIDELQKALFEGPGAIDKMATMDEYRAILERKAAGDAGLGLRNGASRSSEETLARLFDPLMEVTVPEENEDPEDDGSTGDSDNKDAGKLEV